VRGIEASLDRGLAVRLGQASKHVLGFDCEIALNACSETDAAQGKRMVRKP
jgi:hypothetical protein